jgi:hypothetical protein
MVSCFCVLRDTKNPRNELANEKTWMWMKHAMTTRIQFSANMVSCVLCSWGGGGIPIDENAK